MASVGLRTLRPRDPSLLTGRGSFLDDVRVADLHHVAFVRAQVAHALIKGIDTKAAVAVAGVRAVLTLPDIARASTTRRMPLIAALSASRTPTTPFILADKEIAFAGELVAMVVADSRYAAEDGAALVEVDYEPLPVVVDPRQALVAGSPKVRTELANNVLSSFRVQYGDVERAFAGDVRVLKEDIALHRGAGHPMEGRGLVAENRGEAQGLVVWSSTQMPNDLHQAIIVATGLHDDRVRVITPDVGGGFGPKYCVYPEEIAVVCASCLTGLSLKWVEDRREHFLGAIQERDQLWSAEVAFTSDGRLQGVRGQMIHDQGAYTFKAANLPYNSATAVPGPYVLPAYRMDVTVVHTNKVPVSSVRGAGYPQAAFVMERLMDSVARELKLDRAEVRALNLIPASKMPYEKPLVARSGASIVYDSGDYPAAQAKVLAAAGWGPFRERQLEARDQGRFIGIGIANAVKGTGRGPFESGSVRIAASGRISVYTGAAEMGQGLSTALAQIAADELGADPSEVTVIAGDTSVAPLGLGGFASRQLVTAGSSVKLAARRVADKAKKLASHMLEAAEADLELRDGRVEVKGAPGRGVDLGELARVLRGAPGYGFPEGLSPGLEADERWQTGPLAYANVAHVAEVEVDIETGLVRIKRYVALQDSGVLINPMLVEGQVHGGITHGIGNAVLEQMRWDAGGQPLTTNFAEYLIATAPELPRFETMFVQSPSPNNPLGAKGAGEVGTIPAAAAVISAIENALSPFGVRIDHAPVSPADIVALVGAAKTRAGSRSCGQENV
ncbi:MAG: xanthine dehydrogenase family protein molybdopterin-binding subunit [Hyphomicrobiaceae bacterium]